MEDLLRKLLVDREKPTVDWGDRALWLADPAPPEEDEEAFEQYARRIAAGRFARRMVEGDKAAWSEVLREELLNEELPFGFSLEWGIDEETGRIHVDVEIPTRDTVAALGLATMKGRELYEDVCCALLIRFTHEIFRVIPEASEVYMSGFLSGHDPSTGAKTRDIYLRMSTDRDSFLSIDLDRVDPSSAFEGLGGAKKTRRGELVPIANVPKPN